MSRHKLDDVFLIGGAVGVALVGYHLITSGQAGSMVNSLASVGPSGSTTTSQDVGSGNAIYSGYSCPGPYAQLSTLVQANPNLPALITNWQTHDALLSDIDGASPTNWTAFRTYVQRLGYTDPGQYPPQSFCSF